MSSVTVELDDSMYEVLEWLSDQKRVPKETLVWRAVERLLVVENEKIVEMTNYSCL